MGVDGLIVEQGACFAQDHHFATRTEAWVDGEDALLAHGGGEEQLFQVLGEDADGGLVGLLLIIIADLRLDGRLQEAFPRVGDGLAHEFRRFVVVLQEDALQRT